VLVGHGASRPPNKDTNSRLGAKEGTQCKHGEGGIEKQKNNPYPIIKDPAPVLFGQSRGKGRWELLFDPEKGLGPAQSMAQPVQKPRRIVEHSRAAHGDRNKESGLADQMATRTPEG